MVCMSIYYVGIIFQLSGFPNIQIFLPNISSIILETGKVFSVIIIVPLTYNVNKPVEALSGMYCLYFKLINIIGSLTNNKPVKALAAMYYD